METIVPADIPSLIKLKSQAFADFSSLYPINILPDNLAMWEVHWTAMFLERPFMQFYKMVDSETGDGRNYSRIMASIWWQEPGTYGDDPAFHQCGADCLPPGVNIDAINYIWERMEKVLSIYSTLAPNKAILRPDIQRMGLGTEMMRFLLARSDRLGLRTCLTPLYAQRMLFERLGFRTLARWRADTQLYGGGMLLGGVVMSRVPPRLITPSVVPHNKVSNKLPGIMGPPARPARRKDQGRSSK
ncbi:uncharacterized protein L3040_005801 [Drepanopeziza brunnea f. sp. 'multigermtubi']|uniref:uncharacterized protein n=1 Tax=Drepanopeziza brunnea f. sp. 'multigermtubi' TaxID=698441 RepID=UPI00238AF8BA|nr:hypothetical protein L3040_005801 [Drepanopeziza brunnea f. sp. 'multigermtubi']